MTCYYVYNNNETAIWTFVSKDLKMSYDLHRWDGKASFQYYYRESCYAIKNESVFRYLGKINDILSIATAKHEHKEFV
jgi:hypothetical protein